PRIVLASADTYIRFGAANRGRNYGDEDILKVKLDRMETQPSLNYKSFVRFDLGATALPVEKALLRLHVVRKHSSRDVEVLITSITEPWEQYELTWNNAPHEGGKEVARVLIPPAGQWLEVDITEFLNGLEDAETVSFRIESLTDDEKGYIDFA